MQQPDNLISLLTVMLFSIFLAFLIIYSLRYRKFKPFEQVIWLRNGKIRKLTNGGGGFVIPLKDDLIIFNAVIATSDINNENGSVDIQRMYMTNSEDPSFKIKFKAITKNGNITIGSEVFIIGFESNNTLIVDIFPRIIKKNN